MKYIYILFAILLADISYSQTAVFGTLPLQNGNVWVFQYPSLGVFEISTITDSMITFDDSLNYYILRTKESASIYYSYLRQREDNFYVQRMEDNYQAPNHEYKYYLKGARQGDSWSQPDPWGVTDSVNIIVEDTILVHIFNQWLIGITLHLFRSVYEDWQIWTDKFGIIRLTEDLGVGFNLYSCIIDGIAYGDTSILKVKEDPVKINNFLLYQNYPNPFNPSTTINYQVPEFSFVTLKVYDILGREVATLVNEPKNQGRYSVNFNVSKLASGVSVGGGYASGVYIYQLRANNFVSSKKMMLLK